MKKIIIALLALAFLSTPVYAEVPQDTYLKWSGVSEIRQFVRDSGFSEREYKLGEYDCINYKDGIYFGFALDFVEYAETQNRRFIPYAEYTRGGKMWHLKTITFIGNRVYSVDPTDGRVSLIGRVD